MTAVTVIFDITDAAVINFSSQTPILMSQLSSSPLHNLGHVYIAAKPEARYVR